MTTKKKHTAQSILVTGGAGFIGSTLVDRLLADGHQVTTLDNFNDFYDPAIKRANVRAHLDNANFKLFEGDIRDAGLVNECLAQGEFTEVIHLAAMAGVRPSIANPVLYQQVNLVGTMNILEACRNNRVGKLLFASSSSVYGNNPKVPFSETDRVDNPISPYASTKKSGELMVYTYHHLYNIQSACLRFFTVYGPRQRPEMAIHQFTRKIYDGEEIYLFGDGSTRRDYTYVSDIVTGIANCREREYGYEIFNLGRSDTVKLSELITKLEQYLGRKAKIKHLPLQPGDVDQTFADISKARRMLEFEPEVSIDQGLQSFVTWFTHTRRK